MDDVLRVERMERRDGALLRKVGDVIAAEPERYKQVNWLVDRTCGTVGCLAGHTAMLVDGYESHDGGSGVTVVIHGRKRRVSEAAQTALGLTDVEEDQLFGSDWEPAGDPAVPLHERVRDALYALADGATVEEVTA